MGFDPYNRSFKIRESIETSTRKVGAHLGMWCLFPSHSPTLPGAWNVTSGLPSWPAPLQALALVASPRLGLQQCTSITSWFMAKYALFALGIILHYYYFDYFGFFFFWCLHLLWHALYLLWMSFMKNLENN
jgi:hypothetical protein